MMKQLLRVLLINLVLVTGVAVVSNAESGGENRIDLIGKVVDHYYLDFKPLATVELPRLIYDNGRVHVYRSTTSLLNKSERFTDAGYIDAEPVIQNGKIKPATYQVVRTDGTSPQFDFSITSHLVFFWVAALLTFLIFIPLSLKYRKGIGRSSEPRGAFQNIFETLVLFIRDNVARPNIQEDKYEKFMPYLLTAFFAILFMNIFGLLPWGVSSTADVTVTAALAVLTFLATQIFASKDHWKHIFWFPDVPVFIKIMTIPVEIVSQFTKPFALCIRLFANITS